jgi:hypothetical protein
MAIWIYRLMEIIDGEKIKGFKILSYAIAEKIKIFCLQFIK